MMPKLLFSKIRIYEFKDLIRNKKQPITMDILLSRKKQKNNIRCVLVQKKVSHNQQDRLTHGPKLADLLENRGMMVFFYQLGTYKAEELIKRKGVKASPGLPTLHIDGDLLQGEAVMTPVPNYYLATFRSFLQSEFSAENIEFWLACREYKRMTSSGRLSNKAADIYKEFLHPMAQKEVNIDHHTRERIKRSLVKPDLTCFDEAEMHVYRLMEKDSCPRFLKSEAYQNLRNTARKPMQTDCTDDS